MHIPFHLDMNLCVNFKTYFRYVHYIDIWIGNVIGRIKKVAFVIHFSHVSRFLCLFNAFFVSYIGKISWSLCILQKYSLNWFFMNVCRFCLQHPSNLLMCYLIHTDTDKAPSFVQSLCIMHNIVKVKRASSKNKFWITLFYVEQTLFSFESAETLKQMHGRSSQLKHRKNTCTKQIWYQLVTEEEAL